MGTVGRDILPIVGLRVQMGSRYESCGAGTIIEVDAFRLPVHPSTAAGLTMELILTKCEPSGLAGWKSRQGAMGRPWWAVARPQHGIHG